MKYFGKKTGVALLLMGVGFLQMGITLAADPAPGVMDIYANDSFVCTLPIEAGEVNLYKREKSCKYFNYSTPTFKLRNVRSGAFITLSASKDDSEHPDSGCSNNGNYIIELKTIKDNSTYPTLNVYDFQKYDTGKPVVPGLLLIKKEFNGGDHKVSITCVRIDFR